MKSFYKNILYFAILCGILSILLPINILAQPSSMPQIKSEVAVLIDADTGQVLYGKNQNARIYPASTTKIMTALLALERGNLSDIITMSYDAVWSIGRDTSHVALDENEQLNLEQALYALAIESANDAANGIAELIGGSMENFSGMMTKRAKELGANNTNFTNAHGLQDSNHYTSAYDLAIIMAEAVKIPEFTRMFTTVTYSMPPTNRQPETRTFNRKNSLVEGPYAYEGLLGEKTGWTGDSGYTFVAAAKRGGRTLVAAVIRSPDTISRWEDTTSLFDYGFEQFVSVIFESAEFARERYFFELADGGRFEAKLVPKGDFSCLVLKSASKEEIEIEYVPYIEETTGKIGGKAIFSLFGEILGEAELAISYNSGGIDLRSLPVGDASEEDKKNDENQNPATSAFSAIYRVISIILQIIGFGGIIFMILYIRQYLHVQKIKKQRRGYQKNKK